MSPSQRHLPKNTHHSQETVIHALGGIRIRSPSKRAAADPRLIRWVHTCNITAYRNTVSWRCGRDSWPRNVSKVGYAVTLRACSVWCRCLAVDRAATGVCLCVNVHLCNCSEQIHLFIIYWRGGEETSW